MAGHSKWANIKHRKAGQDAKRGKIFTKLIREITVAAKMGGPDQDANPRLRDVVKKSLGANMTRDTVDRAIKRGAGTTDGEDYFEIRYEGYGPAGVAVIVDCLTDNKNRTVGEVRHAFSKHGGNLGTDGSVAYLFSKQGQLNFAPGHDDNSDDNLNEEKIMEIAIEAGAEDVVSNDDGSIEVVTNADDFGKVRDALEAADLHPEHAEITQVASMEVTLDQDGAEKMMKLIDVLEDLDDVQNVYSNADISEEILNKL